MPPPEAKRQNLEGWLVGRLSQRLLGKAPRPSPAIPWGPWPMLGSPSVVEKILAGVILPADNEKVDKLSLDQVVTKFFHIIGQVSIHFYPQLLF